MTNPLTEVEHAALTRLAERRNNIDPQAVVRWQGNLYARIFTSSYILEGADFVRFDGMFPNAKLMQGTEQLEWPPGSGI